MKYFFNIELSGVNFSDAISKVKESLSKEGFGVQMELDFQKILKEKLNADFRKYVVLGVCNPPNALKALTYEDKIGLFLPCNVLIEENKNGIVEVSVVDPYASMMAVENEKLGPIAAEVRQKLQNVLENLK